MKEKNKWVWIEEYESCGCSEDARRKKDLLGYCALHGNSRKNIYKLPTDKRLVDPTHRPDEEV